MEMFFHSTTCEMKFEGGPGSIVPPHFMRKATIRVSCTVLCHGEVKCSGLEGACLFTCTTPTVMLISGHKMKKGPTATGSASCPSPKWSMTYEPERELAPRNQSSTVLGSVGACRRYLYRHRRSVMRKAVHTALYNNRSRLNNRVIPNGCPLYCIVESTAKDPHQLQAISHPPHVGTSSLRSRPEECGGSDMRFEGYPPGDKTNRKYCSNGPPSTAG